jgi:hypothetical protein
MRGRVRDRWVTAAFAAGLWCGCQGRLFSISYGDADVTVVEAGTLLEDLLVDFGFEGFVSMDVVSSQELQNQGVSPGDINGVALVSLSLEALDGQGDLSFIDDLQVYVEGPGLPRARVASSGSFPDGQALVALDVEPIDLTDYVTSQQMTFTTEVSGRRPDADTTVEITFELDIGVTGQGACARV